MARYRNFDGALATSADAQATAPPLDDVRLRRAGLKSALSGLEIALAAPVANRADWLTHVHDALHTLHDVWTRHVVETEAPGAFLDELVGEAPRLSSPASHLRREHSEILAAIAGAERKLATAPAADDDYVEWAAQVRDDLTSLLASLARHRQRGADLIYEAYAVDIGGGF